MSASGEASLHILQARFAKIKQRLRVLLRIRCSVPRVDDGIAEVDAFDFWGSIREQEGVVVLVASCSGSVCVVPLLRRFRLLFCLPKSQLICCVWSCFALVGEHPS